MKDKISIIIPTFNRADYLVQTIESALEQDYENMEIIISDNASTDNTENIVKKYLADERVKYVKNVNNIGMVKNWHSALYGHVSGDWFVILSDDDYFIDKSYLTKCNNIFSKDSDVAIVYGNGYIKYEDTSEFVELNIPFDEITDGKRVFLSRGTVKPQDFILCNVLFKKDIALQYQPFENEFNISCDSELFLSICLSYKVGLVKEHTAVYRVHSSNLIKTVYKSEEVFFNNFNWFLNPYFLAKKLKVFTEKEFIEFKGRIVLRLLADGLVKTRLYFPERYEVFLNHLTDKDHLLVQELLKNKSFRYKLILAKVPILYNLLVIIFKFFKVKVQRWV